VREKEKGKGWSEGKERGRSRGGETGEGGAPPNETLPLHHYRGTMFNPDLTEHVGLENVSLK